MALWSSSGGDPGGKYNFFFFFYPRLALFKDSWLEYLFSYFNLFSRLCRNLGELISLFLMLLLTRFLGTYWTLQMTCGKR